MPRYFFDIEYGATSISDEIGMDLDEPGSLPGEVFDLLRNLIHDRLPEGRHTIIVHVRDETGVIAYRSEMTVDGKRYRR